MNIMKLFKRILTLSLILSVIIASFPLQVLAASFEAEVTASKMAVYEGRSTDSKNLGHLKKGTVVTVIDYADGIAYIEYQGRRGYAKVSDMKRLSAEKEPEKEKEPDHGLGTVTEKEIIVYEKASANSKELAKLKKNATVLVLEVDKNGWAKLENGDSIGYTKKEGLEIDDKAKATASPVKNSAKGTATVKVNSLPIYTSASTDSKLMATLKKGQTFTILATGNGWAKLQNGKHIGYARLVGLTLSGEAPAVTPTPTPKATATAKPTNTPVPEKSKSGLGTVNVHSMYLYESASASSKKLGYVYKGETYTV
ncbi:MAG: hypothetical protein II266_04195, partial [Clostridia bacterium]|nr:hypothetical protein [Clostridia bacterium]